MANHVRAQPLGRNRVLLSVPIPVSPDGTLGRKCPECRRYFKVGGEDLASQTELGCPYCGARAQRDQFMTLDQRRRLRSAVQRLAIAQVHAMLDRTLGSL